MADLATLCLDELSGSGVWDVEAWLKAATARGTSLSHRAVAAAAARQQQQQPAAADMTMTACEAFLCRYACLHQKQAAHSKGLQAAKATGTAASAQAAEGGNKTDVSHWCRGHGSAPSCSVSYVSGRVGGQAEPAPWCPPPRSPLYHQSLNCGTRSTAMAAPVDVATLQPTPPARAHACGT